MHLSFFEKWYDTYLQHNKQSSEQQWKLLSCELACNQTIAKNKNDGCCDDLYVPFHFIVHFRSLPLRSIHPSISILPHHIISKLAENEIPIPATPIDIPIEDPADDQECE